MPYVAIPIPEIKLSSILKATGVIANPGFISMFPCTNENVFKEYLRTHSSQLPNIVTALSRATSQGWVGSPRDSAFFYSTDNVIDFASPAEIACTSSKGLLIQDIFVGLGVEMAGHSGFCDGMLTRYTTALLIANLPTEVWDGMHQNQLPFLDLNWVTDVFVCPRNLRLSSGPHPWLSLRSNKEVWASDSGEFIQTPDTNVRLMMTRAYIDHKFKAFSASEVTESLGTLEVLFQRYS